MLSQGKMLSVFVLCYMSQDFIDGVMFGILQRAGYIGAAGVTAIAGIAAIYDSISDRNAQDLFRRELTNVNHWHWRITEEGIASICKHFLVGILPQAIERIINFCRALLFDMAALCQPQVAHIAFFGPPGVGKSTSAPLILQAIFLGRFGAGSNSKLDAQINKMKRALRCDGRIAELFKQPDCFNYIHNQLTDSTTPKKLKDTIKVSILQMDCTKFLVGIFHHDEFDKVGAMSTTKKTSFFGCFQCLCQSDIVGDKGYYPTGTDPAARTIAHTSIHIESGNIHWISDIHQDYLKAVNEVATKVEAIVDYNGKMLDSGRLAEHMNIVLLT